MRRTVLLSVLATLAAAGPRSADLLTQAPAVAYKVAPTYTPQAIQAGIEGSVVLYAEIGVDGRAHRVRVIKGLGHGLDQQAMEAVRQWEFYPGTKNGIPVNTPGTVEVEFRLATQPTRV
jgi:TonB family protein